MQFNWIDAIIVGVVLYHALDGWERGFVSFLSKTIAFLSSLWLAIRFHSVVGAFLIETFGLTTMWRNVLGYVSVALPSEMIIRSFMIRLLRRIPKQITQSLTNRFLGSLFAGANGLIILAFAFLVIVSFPFRGSVKREIRNSLIGSNLVILSEYYGGSVKSSLDTITQEALKFVTIKPRSSERMNLDIPREDVQLTVDTDSEIRMVELINSERVNGALPPYRVEEDLTIIARDHSSDMIERSYFSHVNPDGNDVAGRARIKGIPYTIIGENLAYAPHVQSAHDGLMESKDHRRNILDTTFTRIGIGVIDAGPYGKMFTQVFAH